MKRLIPAILFVLLAAPGMARAQYQHASFFNGGTSLTATCTAASGTLLSQDYFEGTLQGNTTVTLPASSSNCLSGDIIWLKPTQGTNHSYTLTVNAGSGTSIVIKPNGGKLVAVPASVSGSTGTSLDQIFNYNGVAGTPQWEYNTEQTYPPQLFSSFISATTALTNFGGL